MTRPTPLPQVANQDFCAYCFKPIGAACFETRGRRYCTAEHAAADRRIHAAEERIAEFRRDYGEPAAPREPEQLDLDGLA